MTLIVGSVIWLDQGTPWIVMTAEDMAYNVNVEGYIRSAGP